jgi:hypothetical protein
MASTGTGSDGRKPVSHPNGEVTTPHAMKTTSNSRLTNLFSRKYRITLFNIFKFFKDYRKKWISPFERTE